LTVVLAQMRAVLGHQENELCDDATIALPERRPSRPWALSSEAVAMRQRRNGRVRRQMSQIPYWGAYHALIGGGKRVWRDLRFKDLYRNGKEFELMGRAMGFAALAMLTLFPLLVLVAAASAFSRHGLARWVVYGMGLNGSSAHAVIRLFSAPARVLGTTSVFSVLLLAVFGVTFAGSVQSGFEGVWGLPAGPWHKIWRQAVWLIVFIIYIYAAATVGPVTHHAPAETVSRVSVAVVLGIIFFWWGLRFLVGGRVSYLAAMPGAIATVAFLAGLRAFSSLVFKPLIVANAVTYGALGTVLILQSWLVGVGWVVYGGQLFGRWFYDAWLWALADNRWGHKQPGSGEEGRGQPGSGASRPRGDQAHLDNGQGPRGLDAEPPRDA
jgi:membrane protein